MKRSFGELRSSISVILGVMSATLGLRAFLIPNGFFDGGVMGVSLLLNQKMGWNLSLLIALLNLPFVLLSARQISLRFAIRSVFAILLLSLTVHFVHFDAVTADRLLVSVFGGVFLGLGIGLTIRGSAVIDGTEILAITVSRQSSFTVGDFIALFNFGVFGMVALLVDVQTAMYSMLTYFSASKTVDFVINGIEEYMGVTIISNRYERIQHRISHELGRGVTIYKTEGGFGKSGLREERKAVFCVLTRLEVPKLLLEVEKEDPHAFVFQQAIRDTKGGMIKKRAVH
ncbi:MAG: YitT family protein [Bdellovibrionales bacterium]|nr:YitT family protein [Bdellovibrionales bacterium]